MYVHGSPREPTNEYVFPDDIYNQRKMDALFGRVPQYCFQGHTHLPGIFTFDYRFISPEDCNYQFKLDEQWVMINVGSVGQPRDGDPRAAWLLIDVEAQRAAFRLVPYSIERTQAEIRGRRLPEELAARLEHGV